MNNMMKVNKDFVARTYHVKRGKWQAGSRMKDSTDINKTKYHSFIAGKKKCKKNKSKTITEDRINWPTDYRVDNKLK